MVVFVGLLRLIAGVGGLQLHKLSVSSCCCYMRVLPQFALSAMLAPTNHVSTPTTPPPAHHTLQPNQTTHRGSPLSAAITLSYFQRSRASGWGPLEALQQDCVLCGHFMAGKSESDFYEGVRARLIDKDDKPRWKHASFDEVGGLVSGRR